MISKKILIIISILCLTLLLVIVSAVLYIAYLLRMYLSKLKAGTTPVFVSELPVSNPEVGIQNEPD